MRALKQQQVAGARGERIKLQAARIGSFHKHGKQFDKCCCDSDTGGCTARRFWVAECAEREGALTGC
jgi:hypothetical protein